MFKQRNRKGVGFKSFLTSLFSSSILALGIFVPTSTVSSDESQDSFMRSANKLSVNFNEHAKIPVPGFEKSSNVRLVQIEWISHPRINISASGNISFSGRHGHATSDIVFNTASKVANMNIPTWYINGDFLQSMPNQDVQNILNGADIIGMSYGLNPTRSLDWDRAFRNMGFNTPQNPAIRQNLRNLFGSSDIITVQATGNDGYRDAKTLQWSEEMAAAFNDLHIKVGAARVMFNEVVILPYSSSSAPTVVTLNPFHHGYQYGYHSTLEEAEQKIENILNNTRIVQIPSPQSCSRGGRTDFEGADLLRRYAGFVDHIIPIQDKAKIKDALKNCYIEAYHAQQKRPIEGTSFTTPHLVGMMGGVLAVMRDKYGENALTAEELFAATILSAQPVRKATNTFGFGTIDLHYIRTPAGLLYNENISGFGYIDHFELLRIADEIAKSKQENPTLESKKTSTTTGLIEASGLETASDLEGYKAYAIPVHDDITITRTVLDLQFEGLSNNRTDYIYLQSPTGEKFRIPLTRERNSDIATFGFTNGFFGSHSQGEWKILIPDNSAPLSKMEMIMYGVHKGSSIDLAVERKQELQKPETEPTQNRKYVLNPIQFKIG